MKLSKFFEFLNQYDLEILKSFKIKNKLNPEIWDNYKIDENIREKLIKIAKDFYESVELKAEIKDIVLCGSFCNYNWSEKYSDFDLHIIIDYTDVNKDKDLVKKICDYAKNYWNTEHNIKIKGHDVEVYIQDINDLEDSIKSGKMGGVFSLLNNKWIKKPTKKKFNINDDLIIVKAESIIKQIDYIDKIKDEENYDDLKDIIDKISKKIKNYRKSGLESKEGEFSIGNLVFKFLRRSGYIKKLHDIKRYVYDKQFEKNIK